jgi:hypothetical protein
LSVIVYRYFFLNSQKKSASWPSKPVLTSFPAFSGYRLFRSLTTKTTIECAEEIPESI